jgi:drug/metabolite transporter (DMT)-like permease
MRPPKGTRASRPAATSARLLLLARAAIGVSISPVGAKQWPAAVFLGILGNGFAYFMWFRVIAQLPAGAAGVGSLLTPASPSFEPYGSPARGCIRTTSRRSRSSAQHWRG